MVSVIIPTYAKSFHPGVLKLLVGQTFIGEYVCEYFDIREDFVLLIRWFMNNILCIFRMICTEPCKNLSRL